MRAGYEEATRAGGRAQGKAFVVREESTIWAGCSSKPTWPATKLSISRHVRRSTSSVCEWVEEEERAGRHAPPLKRCEVYLDGTNLVAKGESLVNVARAYGVAPTTIGRLPRPFAETRPHKRKQNQYLLVPNSGVGSCDRPPVGRTQCLQHMIEHSGRRLRAGIGDGLADGGDHLPHHLPVLHAQVVGKLLLDRNSNIIRQ